MTPQQLTRIAILIAVVAIALGGLVLMSSGGGCR